MVKKISLLMAILLLFSTMAIHAASISFEDTKGKSYETAVEVLASLGIVKGKSNTSYAPEENLTRAEMATIILRTMNMESGAKGNNVFEDVTSEHWAYDNISAAYQLGIINGVSAVSFAPDSFVSYEQAVKMIVSALGYSLQAESQGGYPVGYLSKAAHLDILKGVTKESEMTRGNMAQLIYNALDVPLFVKSTFGEQSFDYEVSEKDTFLSHYLKVEKILSHVSATTMAEITAPERTLLSDEVSIADGRIFKKGETNAQNMLGVQAVFYVKKEASDITPDILAITPQNTVSILDVNATDVDSETTVNEFVYTQNGKEESVDISGAELIWNGRVKKPYSVKDLTPKIGTVRLISQGNAVKRIIVESYNNYVVDAVIPDTMEVFFMNGADPDATLQSIIVDPTDRYTLVTDEIGESLPLEGIARWDVVSVCQSADGVVKKIIRSYNIVKGTVKEVSDDKVIIDDKEYPVTNPLTIGKLEVGQKAAYYLDFTGSITAIDTNIDTSTNYGWFVNAVPQKGLGGGVQMKIFTVSGEMKVFDAADRIILDNVTCDDNDILNGQNALYKNGKIYPQLIKYKLTEDETKVSELDTAENRTLKEFTVEDKTDGVFSMGYYMGGNRTVTEFDGTRAGGAVIGNKQYRLGNVIFANVRVSDETPVFDIPSDPTRYDLYEIDTMSNFKWDTYNATKYFAVYDISEEFDVGACVLHNYLEFQDESSGGTGGGGTGSGSGSGGITAPVIDSYPQYTRGKVGLITGISTTLNDKGEAVKTLKMYNWFGNEEWIRVPEEFECLYRNSNSDFLADPYWYNVKGQPRDETLMKSTSYDIPTSSYYRYEFRPQTMRLDANDLKPGDVLHYASANGQITMAAVMMRVDYPGKYEMAPSPTANTLSKGNIDVTSASNFYLGTLLQMYASVVKTTSNGPILKVNLSTMAGQPSGETAYRAIPSTGKFVLWDSEKQKMRTILPDEIRLGDELFSIWKTNSQMLVIVYR